MIYPKVTGRFLFITGPSLFFVFIIIPIVFLCIFFPYLANYKDSTTDEIVHAIFFSAIALFFLISPFLASFYLSILDPSDATTERYISKKDKFRFTPDHTLKILKYIDEEILDVNKIQRISVRCKDNPYDYLFAIDYGDSTQRKIFSDAKSTDFWQTTNIEYYLFDLMLSPATYRVDFEVDNQLYILIDGTEKKCALKLMNDFIKDTKRRVKKSTYPNASRIAFDFINEN
jgi:hypothetical protein